MNKLSIKYQSYPISRKFDASDKKYAFVTTLFINFLMDTFISDNKSSSYIFLTDDCINIIPN